MYVGHVYFLCRMVLKTAVFCIRFLGICVWELMTATIVSGRHTIIVKTIILLSACFVESCRCEYNQLGLDLLSRE